MTSEVEKMFNKEVANFKLNAQIYSVWRLNPQETQIISDGKTLWFYDPFVQQVTAQWVKMR